MPDREYDVLLDFPDDGGILRGDRFYWDQVFVNLIENAIKENPTKDDLVIRVAGEWEDGACLLKVSDNGTGIPAHDLPFVFKRFYRGQKSHSQTIRGTGLGLSIVRRAVEAHGGTVTLTSTPGSDTTFTLKVPTLKVVETRNDGVDSNAEQSTDPSRQTASANAS
jgi:signal transduction histidine kinase